MLPAVVHSASLSSPDKAAESSSVAAASAVSPLESTRKGKSLSLPNDAKKISASPKLIFCHVCKKKKQLSEFSKKQRKIAKKQMSALCSSCAASSAKVLVKKPAKKKLVAEATSKLVPKTRTPSFDLDVAELFKFYMSLDINSDHKEYTSKLVEILVKHRLVRNQKLEIRTSKHNFTVQGFKPNAREFSAWVKTSEGKPYNKLTKQGDDGLYRISRVLRNCLPRGCHAVWIEDKAGKKIQTCLFRGMRKFTGLVSSDDGEDATSDLEISHQDYFRKKTIKDVSTYFSTHKSNGENAKLSVLVAEGTRYLMSGSKNTCKIWPADEPFCNHHTDPDTPDAHPNAGHTIGCLYSNWFRTRSKKIQDKYFSEMWSSKIGNKVMMGEVNRPWDEHVLPISDDNAYIEVFCIIDQSGFEMSPRTVFKFLDDLGMQKRDLVKDKAFSDKHNRLESFWRNTWHSLQLDPDPALGQSGMLYRIHDEGEKSLKTQAEHTASIRASRREGSVLYLCDKDGAVLSLYKVKSAHYIVSRRTRQILSRMIMTPFSKGEIRGFAGNQEPNKKKWQKDLLYNKVIQTRRELEKGMRTLDHVPDYKKKWHEWFEFSFSFLQWLIHKHLMANGHLQLYTAKRLGKTEESKTEEGSVVPLGVPNRKKISHTLSGPPSKPMSPLKRAQTTACNGRDSREHQRACEDFYNQWEYNFGSLMHKYLLNGRKRVTKQDLRKRHYAIVEELQSELKKLAPGPHKFKDVIKPLLIKWKGGVLLEADCNVGGKITGELSVSMRYLLELYPNLFAMETEPWSKSSHEKKIVTIKLLEAQSTRTDEDTPTDDVVNSS